MSYYDIYKELILEFGTLNKLGLSKKRELKGGGANRKQATLGEVQRGWYRQLLSTQDDVESLGLCVCRKAQFVSADCEGLARERELYVAE